MRHLHADVLIAIAEGKEVEYHTEAHNWRTPSTDTVNPITFPGLLWRVKPEPEAEWKQKLRQAAREGKRIERYNQIAQRHLPCQITDFPDQYGFLPDEKESEYRIVPKTVTRWLWAYKYAGWTIYSHFLTESEAALQFRAGEYRKIESSAQEFEE